MEVAQERFDKPLFPQRIHHGTEIAYSGKDQPLRLGYISRRIDPDHCFAQTFQGIDN